MEEKTAPQNPKTPLWAVGITAVLFLILIVVWVQVVMVLTGNIQPGGFGLRVGSLDQALPFDDPNKPDEVSVEKTNSSYKTASSKPSGWFKSGQEADILLSGFGFNNSGGPLSFNHLGILGSDGKRLVVPDRFNNRVLIWNSLPTGNTPPDLVLGQKDFIANNSGSGLDQLNWPVSVSVSPDGKLAVADTMNFRILLWNSFPTKNGQPADIVLSGRDGGGPNKKEIVWPWGVWTDGKKLAVASTRASAALIWNSFPTQNDTPPDIYLTAKGQFGTPRTITSDGKRLIVSDHNAKVPPDKILPQEGVPKNPGGGLMDGDATFFWKSWPITNDVPYDFYMPSWLQGDITSDGKLLLIGTNAPYDTLRIWDKFPESKDTQPDVGDHEEQAVKAVQFESGDGSGIKVLNGKVYISLYNGNRIVGYNSLPSNKGQQPDFVIGSSSVDTNTLKTNYMITNAQPVTDGKSLFVVSDFDRKMYVWKSLPDQSGAKPDFVYDFFGKRGNVNFQAQGIALGQNSLVLVGRGPGESQDIYIWTKLPLNGELPDVHFINKIGSLDLKKLSGVAIDEKYFYLADGEGKKVYVFEGVPKTDSAQPKFSLSIDSVGALSSDGKYLLVSAGIGQTPKVLLYKVEGLSANAKPLTTLQNQYIGKNKIHTSFGSLFATSTEINQVRGWKNIEDAIEGKSPDIILGAESLEDINAEIGQNKLFWPNALAFDGSYLWVGEVKFSNRLLRFSVGR